MKLSKADKANKERTLSKVKDNKIWEKDGVTPMTEIAIEAFRKNEEAWFNADKTQRELRDAVAKMPESERVIYKEKTNDITYEIWKHLNRK